MCVAGSVPGVMGSIRGPLGGGASIGGTAFAVASFSPLSGKCDLEYNCRQLISEQEVS